MTTGRGSIFISNDGSNAPMGLRRSTHLPSASVGFTVTYWSRQPHYSDNNQAQFSLDDGGSNYVTVTYRSDLTIGQLYLSISPSTSAVTIPDHAGWVFRVIRVYNSGTSYDLGHMLDGETAITWDVTGGSCSFGGAFTTINWFTSNNPSFGGWPDYDTLGTSPGVQSGNDPRACTICSAKVWDVKLTNAEVLAEAFSKDPVRTANINSYLPGDVASGADQSGNGYDFTALRPNQLLWYVDEPATFGDRGISSASAFGDFNTVPEPTGTTSASTLFALIESDSAFNTTPPDSTWTPVGRVQTTVDGGNFALFVKHGGGGAGGNYTWGVANTSTIVMVAVNGYQSVLHASSVNSNDTGQAEPWSIDAASVTTQVPNALLLWFGGVDPQDSTHRDSFTAPTGFALKLGLTGSTAIGSGANAWNGLAYAEKVQAAIGATGTVTGTDTRSSGAVAARAAFLVAMAPLSYSYVYRSPDITLQFTGQDTNTKDIRLFQVTSVSAPPLTIVLFSTTPPFGANDIILGGQQSAGAIWDDSTTLSQSAAGFSASYQLAVGAALTLPATAGMQRIGQLDAVASETLAAHPAVSSSGKLDAVAQLTVHSTAALLESGALTMNAALSLAAHPALAESTTVDFLVSLSLAAHPGFSVLSGIGYLVSLALHATAGFADSALLTAQSSNTFATTAGFNKTDTLNAVASRTLAATAGMSESAGISANSSLLLGATAGLARTNTLDINASTTLAATAGDTERSEFDTPFSVHLTSVAGFMAEASVTVSATLTLATHPGMLSTSVLEAVAFQLFDVHAGFDEVGGFPRFDTAEFTAHPGFRADFLYDPLQSTVIAKQGGASARVTMVKRPAPTISVVTSRRKK